METASGRRLSVTVLLLKIASEALRRYPRANVANEGGRIRLFRDINIGVAEGTDDGRIVLKRIMNMTLSIDHRCMDGLQGARFLTLIQGFIEKPGIFVKEGGDET